MTGVLRALGVSESVHRLIIGPYLAQAVAVDTEAVDAQPPGAGCWKCWKCCLNGGELVENTQQRQRQREDIDLMTHLSASPLKT